MSSFNLQRHLTKQAEGLQPTPAAPATNGAPATPAMEANTHPAAPAPNASPINGKSNASAQNFVNKIIFSKSTKDYMSEC